MGSVHNRVSSMGFGQNLGWDPSGPCFKGVIHKLDCGLFVTQAEKEEKAIYMKSPRRQVYINLCVNLVKKLRDASDQSDAEATTKRNPLASKSTLPSPTKRLKIDPSTSADVSKAIRHFEINDICSKPKNNTVKDDEITGT